MAECFWENRPFKSIPLERQKLDTDDTKITDLFKKNLFFGLSNGMDIISKIKNCYCPSTAKCIWDRSIFSSKFPMCSNVDSRVL